MESIPKCLGIIGPWSILARLVSSYPTGRPHGYLAGDSTLGGTRPSWMETDGPGTSGILSRNGELNVLLELMFHLLTTILIV